VAAPTSNDFYPDGILASHTATRTWPERASRCLTATNTSAAFRPLSCRLPRTPGCVLLHVVGDDDALADFEGEGGVAEIDAGTTPSFSRPPAPGANRFSTTSLKSSATAPRPHRLPLTRPARKRSTCRPRSCSDSTRRWRAVYDNRRDQFITSTLYPPQLPETANLALRKQRHHNRPH
jgi:hypothetical protein